MATFTDYFGRLHPLVIHFPIALLLIGALLEGIRIARPQAVSPNVVSLLLAFGAMGAIMAAATGWAFAEHSRQPADMRSTLYWHRWLGIGTAVMALAAWFVARQSNDAAQRSRIWMRRAIVIGTGLLVAVAAHLGALLVWGADYFEP